MTLTLKHLQDICLLGHQDKSKTCRYLKNDELENNKWYCQKLQPMTKLKIDNDIANTKSNFIPSGDNCEGFPLLKHIDQGYDIIS